VVSTFTCLQGASLQALIPDPLADIGLKLYPQGLRRFLTMSMGLGSDVVTAGYKRL